MHYYATKADKKNVVFFCSFPSLFKYTASQAAGSCPVHSAAAETLGISLYLAR